MQKQNLPSKNSFGEEQGEGSSEKNIKETHILKKPETFVRHIEEIKTDSYEFFPVEVFPSTFQEVILETKNTLNFPLEYTGTSILVAISTAIGKSAKLMVKKNWYEFPAIYAALIGNPGANKSHPLETAFNPFEKIDREQIIEFDKKYKEFEEYLSLNKKEKDRSIKPEKPKLSKTILHNFTPEILHQRLTENDRGCGIVSEELATFLEGMNNYSKGDQLSIYLSFWNSKATSIDRVSKPVPLWLPQPFLNIIGTLQPRVLTKLFPVNKTDNGFLQRFLFAFPENVEKQAINDFEIDETVISEYAKWINEYIQKTPIVIGNESGKPISKIYSWSKEAKEYFYEWQAENTNRVNENSDSLIGEILSKFDVHFCRLSLILQIMENYQSDEISLKAVQGASKLCNYFLSNAYRVLDVLENSNRADDLPENKRKLFDSLPNSFNTSEGLEIAKGLGIPERTYKRFLNDRELFKWVARGKYIKR